MANTNALGMIETKGLVGAIEAYHESYMGNRYGYSLLARTSLEIRCELFQ